MRKEIMGIIKDLEIDRPHANDLRRRVLSSFDSQKDLNELLAELIHEEQEDDYPDCSALHAVVISATYDALNNKEAAIKKAKDAVSCFRNLGNDHNESLAHWLIGLLYKTYEEDHLALPELAEAVILMKRSIEVRDAEGNYDKKAKYQKSLQEITAALNSLATKQTNPSSDPGKKTGTPHPWKKASLFFGVQDIAHASHTGKFVFEDASVSAVEVAHVVISGKPHNIYSCRGGTIIKITSNGDYRWLKVAGLSMNLASPVTIEPEDYVLADLKLAYQPGDIVVANLHDPPTPQERAGVIKRYTPTGLKSESTTSIPLIPLVNADVRGVVIAIAKPA
jgi:hypothetical protein